MIQIIRRLRPFLAFACVLISNVDTQGAEGAEIWIMPTGSGGGIGTETDPFSTPTADSFFDLIHDQRPSNPSQPQGPKIVIPEYSTIHLMPGTFHVREGTAAGKQRYCLTLKKGWKVRGAGIDVTTIRLTDNHPAALATTLQIISGTATTSVYAWDTPLDDAEVSDLTVDCNLVTGNQSVANCISAVQLAGANNKISRVRAINWGTTKPPPSECFVLAVWAHGTQRPKGYRNGVIEDCIVEQPGSKPHASGSSAITVGAGPYPSDSGLLGLDDTVAGGWVIRGCTVRDVASGAIGQPTEFNGYTANGRGVEIYNNVALNLLETSSAVYNDSWASQDIVIRDNSFLNVARGVNYQLGTSDATNVAVLNNLITFTNNGTAINFSTQFGHNMRAVRVEGNICYPHLMLGKGVALGVHGDIEISANNNILDGGGGSTTADFFSSGQLWLDLKVLSFRGNHNRRGRPLKLAEGPFNFKLKGFYEEEMTFTPTVAGWYKVLLQNFFSSARLDIWSWETFTEIGLAYTHGNPATLGELTLLYNGSYDSIGAIPNVRLAQWNTDLQLGADELAKYGGFARQAVEVYISSAQVSKPVNIRISGMFRPPAYLGQISPNVGDFAPYPEQTAPVTALTLDIGPGIRTTGPIYAGVSGGAMQQITDGSGHIVSGALGNLPVAKLNDGLGANSSTFWRGDGTWASALQESAEASNTPVTPNTSTSVGATTLRLFEFYTLPAASDKLYVITGIEWKNGTTVAGNTICGAVVVNQTPPTEATVPTIAFGQLTANSGANAIQRVSRIVSQPIRGGATIGIFVQADSASHTYQTLTPVASANNRKTISPFPAGGNVANQDNVPWTASTTKAYLKVYYRGYK